MSQKYAVVTGASSGVGGAIALELAQSGYFIALIGRNQEKLSAIAKQINSAGESSKIYVANLNTLSGIQDLKGHPSQLHLTIRRCNSRLPKILSPVLRRWN